MSEFNGYNERDDNREQDWEDPQAHDYCTRCDMCQAWEGRTYESIRADLALIQTAMKGTA
jgi:hypothetical protein